MSRALSRRAVVTAAPAAIVAAALPAFAAGALAANADAELFALREPYERTLAGIAAVSPAHSAAEEAYFAARTADPSRSERELRKAAGLTIAERRYLRAVNANTKIIWQIQETPAHTLEGVLFKARVCKQESYDPDVATSLVDDLLAMAGGLDA